MGASPVETPPARPRLLDQVRDAILRLHYSRRTEESYSHWIKRFIYFTASVVRGETPHRYWFVCWNR